MNEKPMAYTPSVAEEEKVVIENKSKLTNQWRLSKKVYTEEIKKTSRWEYFYEKDSRIEKVKEFYEGELGSGISKFKFDNNGKITSYYTQGTSAEVIPYTTKIQYDDKDRVAKINDVNSSNEQTDNYKILIMLTAGIFHLF